MAQPKATMTTHSIFTILRGVNEEASEYLLHVEVAQL